MFLEITFCSCYSRLFPGLSLHIKKLCATNHPLPPAPPRSDVLNRINVSLVPTPPAHLTWREMS